MCSSPADLLVRRCDVTTTSFGGSMFGMRVMGHEDGQPVVLEFRRQARTVRLLSPDGRVLDEHPLHSYYLVLQNGTVTWGPPIKPRQVQRQSAHVHRITIEPDQLTEVRELVAAVDSSRVKVQAQVQPAASLSENPSGPRGASRDDGRELGIVLSLLGLVFLFASGVALSQEVGLLGVIGFWSGLLVLALGIVLMVKGWLRSTASRGRR
jgi:hypothetical protein